MCDKQRSVSAFEQVLHDNIMAYADGEDRQILVDNEEQPDQVAEDENAGGFVADNSNSDGLVEILPYNLSPVESDFQSHVEVTDAPIDKWNYTYIVFYLLGTATMTPWNFFITAEDVSMNNRS